MSFALFIGMILLIGGFAWYTSLRAKKRTKRRTEAYRAQAVEMGLEFAESADELVESLGDFALFKRGHTKKTRNVLSGDAGDVKISIFDYHFTTGDGKNTQVNQQTVVLLQSANVHSPVFSMRQQGFFDKFGKVLGFQDIDFTSHTKFSQMFVLQGADEEAVRRFFTPSLLEFFETQEKVSVEGGMGRVMIYSALKLLPPEKAKDALANAYEVYGHIVDQA